MDTQNESGTIRIRVRSRDNQIEPGSSGLGGAPEKIQTESRIVRTGRETRDKQIESGISGQGSESETIRSIPDYPDGELNQRGRDCSY